MNHTLFQKLIRLPLKLIPANAVMRVVSGPLAGMKWVAGTAPHGAWLGRLEREGLEWAVTSAPAGSTFWDIGANVGLYSLAFSRAAGAAGKVIAFEPAPQNVAALKRHLELNEIANVEVVTAAVGEKPGTLKLAAGEFNSEFHVSEKGDVEVAAVTLDGWRAERNAAPPAVVKIDVEGFEAEVLRGGEKTFWENGPTIFLAIHGERQHAECLALLLDWGYDVKDSMGRVPVAKSYEWLACKPRGAAA